MAPPKRNSRPTTSDYSPPTAETYLAILRDVAKGLRKTDIERHPILSKATVSRVLGEKGAKKKMPPIVASERVRRALEDMTGSDIPPAAVAVQDEEHYEWARAGLILRERFPALYRTLYDNAMDVAKPILLAEKREREAMIKLRKLKRP